VTRRSPMLPHVTIRIAGVSSSAFDRLVFDRTIALIDESLDLEAICLSEKDGLCAALETAIGSGVAPVMRGPLLALKRDVFNDRVPGTATRARATAAMAGFDPILVERLRHWIAARLRRQQALQQAEAALAGETASGRHILRRLFRHRRFRRGLALASPILSRAADAYVDAANEADVRRLRHTEQSLLRYYTRTAFKLSPFSLFTSSTLVRLTDEPPPSRALTARFPRTRGIVRLNRAFVGQLAARLSAHQAIAGYVPVARAGSLTPAGQRLRVLRRTIEDTGRQIRLRVPHEAIVTAPAGAAIESVLECLARHGGVMQRRDLVNALAPDSVDAAAAVDKLIAFGLLVHRIPLPEDDSTGVTALVEFLAGIPDSDAAAFALAAPLREALLALDALREPLAAADHAARREILAEMERLGARAFACPDPKHNVSKHDVAWAGILLYEDCVATRLAAAPRPAAMERAIDDLDACLTCCGPLVDDALFHRRTVAAVLDEVGGGPLPLLEFAEHWVRATAGGWKQAHYPLDRAALNPLGLDDLRQLLALRAELGAVIAQDSTQPEIDLLAIAARQHWAEKIEQLGFGPVADRPSWYSCYGQPLFGGGDDAMLVVNGLDGGRAAGFAPMVATLAAAHERDRCAEQVRTAGARYGDWTEPCQLRATFDYNANLVPTMTSRAIDYADDMSLSRERRIDLCDLEVRAASGRAVLIHRSSQRQLTPLDYGKMAPALYPPLYRLLVLLGSTTEIAQRLFEPYLWRGPEQEPTRAEHFPRIRFGACLLRRRGWSIPAGDLPHAREGESRLKRLVRVRRWQRERGLPDEVFVRATSLLEWKNQAQRRQDRQTWNRRKPQYIDFRNDFLIDVLDKMIEHTETRLYIEEMLPDRASWRQWGLKRPVECVIDLGTAGVPSHARSGSDDEAHYAVSR
jgi:hypothetical protein